MVRRSRGFAITVYQGRGDRGSLGRVSWFKAHGSQMQKAVLQTLPQSGCKALSGDVTYLSLRVSVRECGRVLGVKHVEP